MKIRCCLAVVLWFTICSKIFDMIVFIGKDVRMDEAIYANQTSRVNGAYDYIVYCDLLDHELVFAPGIL